MGANDFAHAVARQADGKLIVAGSSDANGDDFVVIRYNTNCSVDSTFGSADGPSGLTLVRLDASGSGNADEATGVAVQPDGKIIVAGWRNNGTNDDIVVVRLTSTGALDDTWDGDGIAVLDSGSNERATGVALQSNGRVVVSGWSDHSGNQDGVLARFNTNGSPDNTFNGVGWRMYDVSGAGRTDQLTGVVVQADGKIAASGWSNNGTNDDLNVIRVGTNGLLDGTFATGGIYLTGSGSSEEKATGIALTAAGNIVYCGFTNFIGSNDFYVNSLTSSGASDGFIFIDFNSGSSDSAAGIAVQPDGKFVIAGVTGGSYGVARVIPGSGAMSLDATFNGTGLATANPGGSDEAEAVLVQPDGRIVAVGSSNPGALPDFSLARFQGSPLMTFSASSYSVNENVGNAVITVKRTGATQDPVTVHVATSNGTASAGSDYTAVSTDLAFTAGQTSKTFNVPITNDGTTEGPETINLTLSAGGGTGDATLGTPSTAVLTIKASDQKPDGLIKPNGGSYIGNNIYNTTGASQTSQQSAARGQKKIFYIEVQNDGNVTNSFTVKGGKAPAGFSVAYFNGTSTSNITKYIQIGNWSTGNLAPGAIKLIRVEITVSSTAAHGAIGSFPVTATWTGDGTRTDTVKANVKVS